MRKTTKHSMLPLKMKELIMYVLSYFVMIICRLLILDSRNLPWPIGTVEY